MTSPDPAATRRTRQRYDRIAPFYDLMEIVPERLYSPWRVQLWSQAQGQQVLGIGVATSVFCSVPDPVLGLREARRVLKPAGKLLLLEHVRSDLFLLGPLMDLLNPLVVNTMGPNINRRTEENVRTAGLVIEKVENLGWGGVYKLIFARRTV